MNTQRLIVALATVGSVALTAFGGEPDHTQRGLVRPASGGSNTSPVSGAPPEPAASAPVPSAPSQPAAPANGPQHATTPHSTGEPERRALGGSASPTPSAVFSKRLPSGVDTARAVAATKAQPSASTTRSAPAAAHRFGTESPASGSVIIPAATSTAGAADHTRRNLVHTIGSSGAGAGSGGRLLWGSSRGGGRGAGAGSSTRTGAVAVDTFNPGAHWSSGFPTTASTFGPYGNNPWSYSNFLYGGPGWALSEPMDLIPEPFTYEPYLGADVRAFEVSVSPGPAFISDPFAMSAFSGGLGVMGPSVITSGAASNGFPPAGSQAIVAQTTPAQAASAVTLSRPAPRVNTSYDVRPDFAVAVDAALNGDYSSSIYAMRRAAGTNPVGLIGARSSVGNQIAADAESKQRAGQALAIYQSASRSVVSEADAQFMVGALAAALGDTSGADAAVVNALAAGDASGSAVLLHRELAATNTERIGGWVTGTPVGN